MNQTQQRQLSDQTGRRLKEPAERVNAQISALIASRAGIYPRLKDAMEYTAGSGGKRIRAAVLMWSCEAVCGQANPDAVTAAAAVEMIHTYSLIHDDLPAMDDDDFRRGKPSCHKAFGEAAAILTGDALLTLAFEVLADEISDPAISAKLISTLARAAGPEGMVAGQMADLEGEKAKADKEKLEYIHNNKTAKMFAASAEMGGICGQAEPRLLEALREYGTALGLGFQVCDDLLDVTANTGQLGKTAGKDAEQGKITYPALLGLEASQRTAAELAEKAVKSLDILDGRADILRKLPLTLLERTK